MTLVSYDYNNPISILKQALKKSELTIFLLSLWLSFIGENHQVSSPTIRSGTCTTTKRNK